LRYANVYGPRQDGAGEAGVIAIFCEKVLAGVTPTINGDGGQTRDFVYVGDVVNANLLALDCKTAGPFNIGTGVETDMNVLASLVTKAAGVAMNFNHGPAKLGEQRRSALDPTRAKKDLGWQPTIDLAHGITETLEYFKKKSSGA
jgi:UDP-glucose 4-epimerase